LATGPTDEEEEEEEVSRIVRVTM